jgi:hypothetical protein
MARVALARNTKELQGTAELARERERAVADPEAYRRIFLLTLQRRDQAQKLLDGTHPDDWMHSPCHKIIDAATNQLVRLAPMLNFGIVVPQRPVAENNPWMVLRGGKKAG